MDLNLDIPSADSGEPEDVEGARWMPWHPEPKKDVASCDKPRGGANGLRSADLRMGQPARGHARARPPERIGRDGATGGTETSKYPEEEKSNEIPQVVASERGPRPNRRAGDGRRGCGTYHMAARKARGSGTAWEGRRDRVTAPYAKPRALPVGTRVPPDT